MTWPYRSSYEPGRPHMEADIEMWKDNEMEFYDKFFGVMRGLSYREMMALARCFKVHYVTVWRWRHAKTSPRDGIMRYIIDWGERGKPIKPMQRYRGTLL